MRRVSDLFLPRYSWPARIGLAAAPLWPQSVSRAVTLVDAFSMESVRRQCSRRTGLEDPEVLTTLSVRNINACGGKSTLKSIR